MAPPITPLARRAVWLASVVDLLLVDAEPALAGFDDGIATAERGDIAAQRLARDWRQK